MPDSIHRSFLTNTRSPTTPPTHPEAEGRRIEDGWTPSSCSCAGGVAIAAAIVATLEGLVLGPYGDQFYERWAEVEHLESALRLVLARRLGRLAVWTDWIHIDKPVEEDQWSDLVQAAWGEVSRLGRGPDGSH